MDVVSLDYVQQAFVHKEMRQSKPSGHLSGAESVLTGPLGEIPHAIGQDVLDAVTWVIFASIVHYVTRLHVLDVVMSVIFSVIVPENVNGTSKDS